MTANTEQLEWFLPDEKGITPIGPFSTQNIEERIKSGRLTYDDYVSCPEFKNESWLRIYEFPHFKELMKKRPICPPPKLLSKGIYKGTKATTKDQDEFLKEISDPQKLTGNFIIHNNQKTLKGNLTFVGADFVKGEAPKTDFFKKGDEVTLTVYNSAHVKSFTVLTAILEKELKDKDEEYKFYFIRINPEVKRRIYSYLKEAGN